VADHFRAQAWKADGARAQAETKQPAPPGESLVAGPTFPNLDSGLASVTAVPGGVLWVVGVTTSTGTNSQYVPLIKYHP
jgi:hypothetical protein